jgi:hypothetical protein
MSTATAPRPAKPAHVLPPPLVHIVRHPLRWAAIFAVTIIVGIVVGHLGPLIVTGVYDLLTQSVPVIKTHWDMIPVNWRHNFFRDYQEFFLGGLIFQFFAWNAYSRRRLRRLERHEALDAAGVEETMLVRAEKKLHIPTFVNVRETGLRGWQIPYGFLWAEIYGLGGFLVVYAINAAIHHAVLDVHVLAASAGHSTVDNLENVDLSSKLSHTEGLVASFFFARRALGGVFDGVQLWFAEHALIKGRKPGLIITHLLPHYAARVNGLFTEDTHTQGYMTASSHSHWERWVTAVTILAALALAAYGYEVLNYGHVLKF